MQGSFFNPDEENFLNMSRDREDRGGHWHDINWTWADSEKEMWKPLDSNDDLQKFYNYWRNRPEDPDFLQQCPYRLPSNKATGPPFPFHPCTTSGDHILVTNSYIDILHRLMGLRISDKSVDTSRGAIVTGQPGTGALL
jgi:hypothetical protein